MTDVQWEDFGTSALAAAGVVYFLALLSHLFEWATLRNAAAGRGVADAPETRRTAMARVLGLLLTGLGGLIHLGSLVGRGMAADPNRVPWGNMYEFAISGAFFMVLIYLLTVKKFRLTWLAPWLLIFVIAIIMVAAVWLYKPVAPLTEALNSYWLVIHVVAAVIATAAFSIGGILTALWLVKNRAEKKAAAAGTEVTGYLARIPGTAVLDRVAYRMHAFGFPVWTFAVLITGPIWAHEAWSRYWNWDPKEVWAFITWVVYAAYLHARTTAGMKGKVAAVLALVGMATLWWSFIGVNFFSTTSMHSYAESSAVVVTVDQLPSGTPSG